MQKRSCSTAGCVKPHRAKGMCVTHYNQLTHARRHVPLPCAYCGEITWKQPRGRYAERFCSLACRDMQRRWNGGMPLSCPVPDGHRSRSTQVPRDHPSRVVIVSRAPVARFHAGYCAECRSPYIIDSECVSASSYCSHTCQRRTAKRARRAREAGASGSFTWDSFVKLAIQLGNVCAYCGTDNDGQPFDPDHVVPLSRDGHNGLTNILPACRACNCDKRDLLVNEWATDRARRGLPPRRYDVSRFAHLTAHATLFDYAA